ncbi:MAG: glutamine--fructose-6-phosphate transaminase (isomerizing) [Clostridiales bacterium]|jgi:glucosamine--fructose-6-phosphate aminotransferase (isomerizing)|nr:glutamine--fructose-6-phosphate transaminase (isomerizing) [Clostridiales bacterium]
MCGIVGYVGREDAAPFLIEGLRRLEYRGYDSAGIAVSTENGIVVRKSKGRLSALEEKIRGDHMISGNVGIGHTRWATHGEPSDVNAHPQPSASGRFVVVHNGVIDNYLELKNHLIRRGYEFASETDTEVIAHLIERYYNGDMVDALNKLQTRLKGSYSLGVLSADNPGQIAVIRKDSPLILGERGDEKMLASDIPAMLKFTRDFYELGEGEIAILSREGIAFYDSDKEALSKSTFHVDWDMDAAEKGGYEHFMIKEIMEQPRAISDTITPRLDGDKVLFGDFNLTAEDIAGFDKIYITACGSAYHAGIIGKYVIQSLTRKSVDVELASEFRYGDPIISEKTLVIVVSQSGETADSLAALRYAKAKGARVLGVVNVVGSSIAKEADVTLFTNAGPEIAVATTKAYSCQLIIFYLLAVYMAEKIGSVAETERRRLLEEIKALPGKVAKILENKDDVQRFAALHFNARDVFFIGRGMDYGAGLEGSLKLKEISYIHSEAYAAGELKHGTIALIERDSLVVAIAANRRLFDKLISNVMVVKARGACVCGVTWEGNKVIEESCDFALYVPETEDLFAPSLSVITLQLFSYYVASMRGADIDKPRNLAKSVTIE